MKYKLYEEKEFLNLLKESGEDYYGTELDEEENWKGIMKKINDRKEELNRDLMEEEKLNDSSLTPSGRIVSELQNNNKSWEELNLELAREHSQSFKRIETDLNYLSKEAKSSLEKFNELGNHQEEEFDVYLDKFLNDI